MEDYLRDAFISALFKGATSQIPGRAFTSLPVKQYGIAFCNPTQTVGANCMSFCVITGHIVAALHGTAEFRAGDHILLIGEVRDKIHRRHAEAADTALRVDRAAVSTADA